MQELSPEQLEIQRVCRDFAANEIRPVSLAVDEADTEVAWGGLELRARISPCGPFPAPIGALWATLGPIGSVRLMPRKGSPYGPAYERRRKALLGRPCELRSGVPGRAVRRRLITIRRCRGITTSRARGVAGCGRRVGRASAVRRSMLRHETRRGGDGRRRPGRAGRAGRVRGRRARCGIGAVAGRSARACRPTRCGRG